MVHRKLKDRPWWASAADRRAADRIARRAQPPSAAKKRKRPRAPHPGSGDIAAARARIETYAREHGLSFNAAKRRLGLKH